MRLLLMIFLTMFLVAVSGNAQQGVGSDHVTRVFDSHRGVPCPKLVDTSIQVDGNLAEWQPLHQQAVAWHQLLGHVSGKLDTDDYDAAVARMRRDAANLYVAIKVRDRSILPSAPQEDYEEGDFVNIYLDLRPVSGSEQVLGTEKHTEQVFHFQFAPVEEDSREVPWRVASHEQKEQKGRDLELENVRVKGSRFDQGYIIEMAIPLEALAPEAPTDRLNRPVGVAFVVSDQDKLPDGGKTRRQLYSWSGQGGYSEDASQFACTRPEGGADLSGPWITTRSLHKFGDKSIAQGGDPRLLAGAASVTGAENPEEHIKLDSEFGQSEYDRPPDWEVESSVDVPAQAAFKKDAYPELGITFHRRQVKLPRANVPAGRYTFTNTFPGLDRDPAILRFYALPVRIVGGSIPLRVQSGQPDLDEVLKELTSGTAKPRLDKHYVTGETSVSGKIRGSVPAEAWFAWSKSAEAALAEDKPVSTPVDLRLKLFAEKGEGDVVWSTDVALKPVGSRFTLPADEQEAGEYKLIPFAIDTDGNVHKIQREQKSKTGPGKITYTSGVPFVIYESYQQTLSTEIRDAPDLRNKANRLGNPTRNQFPNDNAPDREARRVADLHLFKGRIYVGCGDANRNRGPVKIWSFSVNAARDSVSFREEYTVDDEGVFVFRNDAETLYVPGIDAKGPWRYGNYYYKRDGEWTKRRTVPHALHVFDVAPLEDAVYVSAHTRDGATILRSTDDGRSWTRCDGPIFGEVRCYQMVPFGERIFIAPTGAHYGGYVCAGTTVDRAYVPLLPTIEDAHGHPVNMKRFGEGAVYSFSHLDWGAFDGFGKPKPLLWLPGLKQKAQRVALPEEEQVSDIVVRNERCYVLTRPNLKELEDSGENATLNATVYSSSDMKAWTREFESGFPAVPSALEVTDKAFFIALGNSEHLENSNASGSVYRVTRP